MAVPLQPFRREIVNCIRLGVVTMIAACVALAVVPPFWLAFVGFDWTRVPLSFIAWPLAPGPVVAGAILHPGVDSFNAFLALCVFGPILDIALYAALVYGARSFLARRSDDPYPRIAP